MLFDNLTNPHKFPARGWEAFKPHYSDRIELHMRCASDVDGRLIGESVMRTITFPR